MKINFTKVSQGVRFSIRVVPKSSRNTLTVMDGGILKVKITAPPVEGKANEACIKYLASISGVTKSCVNIVSGLKSKTKIVEIRGNPDQIISKLESSLSEDV